MTKQTVENFLANGGNIQHVHYKTFGEVSAVPTPGMRGLINTHKMNVYVGRKAGIASGKARRVKSLQNNNR